MFARSSDDNDEDRRSAAPSLRHQPKLATCTQTLLSLCTVALRNSSPAFSEGFPSLFIRKQHETDIKFRRRESIEAGCR